MSRIKILDADPELGRGLDRAALGRLYQQLVTDVRHIPRGRWRGGEPRAWNPPPRGHLGLLVLDGMLARDILLPRGIATELVGPGDVIQPWASGAEHRLVPFGVRWSALEPTRLAELDGAFASVAGAYPPLIAALLERSAGHCLRLATARAVSQLTGVETRLLLTLWRLAEHWGRVTPNGVVLPLRLSHRTLGQLIGATRPSVSAGMRRLRDEGALTQREDGSLLLDGSGPPADLAGGAAHVPWRPPALTKRERAQVAEGR